MPLSVDDKALIETIRDRYRDDPYGFEACAGALTRMLLPEVARLDLTRPWRDGGRGGIGSMRVGRYPASIEVAFALEAKCYALGNAVGVREMSRLISRIKHREFGLLVTTSYVDTQAYREVVDDGHPVIIVSARDIVGLLRATGIKDVADTTAWLAGIAATPVAPGIHAIN